MGIRTTEGRTGRYPNIPNHLSHSPFFPHTSQTFPCEAQVPLNSPPLRNINLTDINIKNKEINPMVIRNTIISYEFNYLLSTCWYLFDRKASFYSPSNCESTNFSKRSSNLLSLIIYFIIINIQLSKKGVGDSHDRREKADTNIYFTQNIFNI